MSSVRLGLIGHNIAYSKSTDIFEAIFRRTGQDGSFEVYDFAPSHLSEWLSTTAVQLNGFAVTIPHKQQLLRRLDEVDAKARAIGAVNSVAVVSNRLHGYNTDYQGVIASLTAHKQRFSGRTGLILGTGGAARAVMRVLVKEFNLPRFVLASRSLSSAELFRSDHERKLGGVEIEIGLLDRPHWGMADIGLIVNCTPLAGFNHLDELPPIDFAAGEAAVYFDLNYNRPNQAVAIAREAGLIAIDGARMLVEQAVESYRLWTGLEVCADDILKDVFGDE